MSLNFSLINLLGDFCMKWKGVVVLPLVSMGNFALTRSKLSFSNLCCIVQIWLSPDLNLTRMLFNMMHHYSKCLVSIQKSHVFFFSALSGKKLPSAAAKKKLRALHFPSCKVDVKTTLFSEVLYSESANFRKRKLLSRNNWGFPLWIRSLNSSLN